MSHITTTKIKLKNIDITIFRISARNAARNFNLTLKENAKVKSLYGGEADAMFALFQQSKKKKLLYGAEQGFGYNVNGEVTQVGEHWGGHKTSFDVLTNYIVDDYIRETTVQALKNAGYSVETSRSAVTGELEVTGTIQ